MRAVQPLPFSNCFIWIIFTILYFSNILFSVLHHCESNIFGFLTVSQTKAIWICHLGLWETLIPNFHHFLTFYRLYKKYIFLLSRAIDFILKSKSPCFRCCVRVLLQSDAEHTLCQLRITRPLRFAQWEATEAARFRFLSVGSYGVPFPLRQTARLLPGPSREPGWEPSGDIDRTKVCVWEKTTPPLTSPGKFVKSQRQIWVLNGVKTSRDGAEFREFVRSAVDFLRLTTGEFRFSHSTQSVFHTSCLFGNSLVTFGPFSFGSGSFQSAIFFHNSWGDTFRLCLLKG